MKKQLTYIYLIISTFTVSVDASESFSCLGFYKPKSTAKVVSLADWNGRSKRLQKASDLPKAPVATAKVNPGGLDPKIWVLNNVNYLNQMTKDISLNKIYTFKTQNDVWQFHARYINLKSATSRQMNERGIFSEEQIQQVTEAFNKLESTMESVKLFEKFEEKGFSLVPLSNQKILSSVPPKYRVKFEVTIANYNTEAVRVFLATQNQLGIFGPQLLESKNGKIKLRELTHAVHRATLEISNAMESFKNEFDYKKYDLEYFREQSTDILMLISNPEFIKLNDLNLTSTDPDTKFKAQEINQLRLKLNRLAYEFFGGKKIGMNLFPVIIYPEITSANILDFINDIQSVTNPITFNQNQVSSLTRLVFRFLPKIKSIIQLEGDAAAINLAKEATDLLAQIIDSSKKYGKQKNKLVLNMAAELARVQAVLESR